MGGRESHPFGKDLFELESASDRVSEKGSEKVPLESASDFAKRLRKDAKMLKKALRRLSRGSGGDSQRGFAPGEVQSVIFDNTHAL